MKIHNQKRKKSKVGINIPYTDAEKMPDFLSLADKYTKMTEDHHTTYSIEQIKNYLAYIKSAIHPYLSPGAASVIKSFYLALR